LIRCLRDEGGHSSISIRHLVEEFAASRGIPVPPGIYDHIPRDHRRGRLIVIPVAAAEDEYLVNGRVTDINQVSFFRRFGFPDNAMGRGILGDLVSEAYLELLIREDCDDETAHSAYQFTCYLPRRCVEWSRVTRGAIVEASLSPHRVAGRDPIWIANEIRLAR
jgi:hypothetical protein